MNRKKGFLLFITSWLLGCGQMYQGYMKRGLSLMLGGCLLVVTATALRLDMLMVFLIPLWLYAFFDSYNLYNLCCQEQAPADDWLFGLSAMDQKKLSTLFRGRHSIIGWVLVLVGFYALFETSLRRVLNIFCQSTDQWWLYESIMNLLPRLAITVGIIALGIWFIRGPKAPKKEDIPPFTPPVGPSVEAPVEEEPDAVTEEAPAEETPAPEQEEDHGEQ